MRILKILALWTFSFSMLCIAKPDVASAYLNKDYRNVTIVFIPGIYGSILKDENGKSHWGEDGVGDYGLSLETYPTLQPYLFEDVKFSIGMFEKTIRGYSGVRQNLQQIGESITVFPYDWRRSNKKTAEKLDEFLCSKFPKIRKNERIVFVAHSMGGLVLRHWIKDHMGKIREGCQGVGIENINSFVFAGTPHIGSMEPVRTLLNGKTSLNENPIFSWLFTERMASDAITFESAYELLPAANISGPGCINANDNSVMRLSKDIGTGKDIPLFLDNIENWRALEIPVSLPSDYSRANALSLIEGRIDAASAVVCELLQYETPPAVSAKMDFVVGELKDRRSNDFKESTVESIEIVVRPGKKVVVRENFGKGDGTVPYWSAEPSGMRLFARRKFPHSTNSLHADILDDAVIIAHLQRVIEDAAYDVALLGDQPFGFEIKNKAQLLEATKSTSILHLETLSPEVYAAAISFLSVKANELGISGLDIYRDVSGYKGESANRYRAMGFAVASEVGTDLNDISKAWANQNAALSLLKVGNVPLAAATAIRTGEVTAQFINQPDITYEAKYLKEFSNVEQGWKSIISSTLPRDNGAIARDFIAEKPDYDIDIFRSESIAPYAILPKDILGVRG